MSRFLFVVPPLTGHVNPTLAVGAGLAARGHRVAWTGHASVVAPLLPPDAELFATDHTLASEAFASIVARSHGLRGAEAFRFLWKDVILALGEAMLPAVEAAVDRFAPDVLVVDQQAIAGALVARRRGLRWATSATTSSELADPFAIFPLFGTWIAEELRAFQHRAGIAPEDAERGDLRFSDHLVLAFSTQALVGGGPFPSSWRFVGPAIGTRPAAVEFPWEWLDPRRRLVLITLGTVNAASGGRFLTAAVDAASRLDGSLQAIVVAPDGLLDVSARNVLVRASIPQLKLLPHCDAVVCHAGHNTVCEALARGLPLVVAPIRDDQPIIAEQVVAAGAGVRIKYGRAGADEIETAIRSVLFDDAYRRAAARIRASFRTAGGASAACDALESLAAARVPEAMSTR
ncbi:MAG TPA: nucleotide disphospho-sugar-binding domain-containing protein [Candidatus Acidoferrum sp.]|nr:nucleotide disphospho-sugar-binding domain-containing protein [Candidatus Acidoferrum sp.]